LRLLSDISDIYTYHFSCILD